MTATQFQVGARCSSDSGGVDNDLLLSMMNFWDLSSSPDFQAVVGAPVSLPRLKIAPLELARTFSPVGFGPTEARRFVTATLAAWGHLELVDDAAVITTELATNAVVHAQTEFTVSVCRRPDGTIRVTVADGSPEPPRQRHPEPFEGSGRGLRLVEAIAAGWGADALPDGKLVWAQLAG